MSSWLDLLRKAEKTCIIHDGKRKIHYKFSEGDEMAEEYDLKTNLLLRRKWRRKPAIGGIGKWETEVGANDDVAIADVDGIIENNSNPIFMRKDVATAFQWRIRNLPYPLSTYSVTVDNNNVIIKTTNKKYFKKFRIPDMDRMKLHLEQEKLSFTHSNNTLIISYTKPQAILDLENHLQKEIAKVKITKEQEMDCKQS